MDKDKTINDLSYYIGETYGYEFGRNAPQLTGEFGSYGDTPLDKQVSDREREILNDMQSKAWAEPDDHEKRRKLWGEAMIYRKSLMRKYMPHYMEKYIPKLPEGTNMKMFLDGFKQGSWESDVCHYDCKPESMEIFREEFMSGFYLKIPLDA